MAGPPNFDDLDYEGFRKLAQDKSLSKYEQIGFPDSYRQGHEAAIFADIRAKLPGLDKEHARVVDIGPGVSDLPRFLIQHCQERHAQLCLVDSPEMLAQLPDGSGIRKVEGLFPRNAEHLAGLKGTCDAVISYSVLHYAFVDTNLFGFLDAALALLAPEGRLLLGDIPNVSMRRRFFASSTGKAFHKAFMKVDSDPPVDFNRLEPGKIDDAVVFGLLERARAAGFHAYVVPQGAALPMANRREDLLFIRP